MTIKPLNKSEEAAAYRLTSNSAVPMAMEPSMSMATREGEREATTPNPCEKTRSGTLPQGSNTT